MPADQQQPQQPQQQQPETRSKRAKIITACGECRRKKTKCNGEQPCRNCLKSSVPCVYPASHGDDKRNGPSKAALEAIEERLKAIEDMLKTIVHAQLSMGDLDPVAVNRFLNKDQQMKQSVSSPPPSSLQQHGTPPSMANQINHGPSSSSSSSSSSYHHHHHHLYISPSPQPSPSIRSTNTNTPPTSNSTGTAIPSPPPSSSSLTQSYRSSPPNSTSSTSSGGHELRLPSIHSLSAPSAEHRDLPPLGAHHQDYYYTQQSSSSTTTSTTAIATTSPSHQSTGSDTADNLDRKRKR